jgi:hypothetical protein
MRLLDTGVKGDEPGHGAEARITGENVLPGRVNYLIGNNPARWHTEVPTYRRVRLANVYPGVDLLYYGNQGRLEYDFVIAPGADPESIRMRFSGARLKLDRAGNLEITLTGGKVAFERPVIYQEMSGRRRTVLGGFRCWTAPRWVFVSERTTGRALWL